MASLADAHYASAPRIAPLCDVPLGITLWAYTFPSEPTQPMARRQCPVGLHTALAMTAPPALSGRLDAGGGLKHVRSA